MLGREVVERHQLLAIFLQTQRRLRVLWFIGLEEQVKRFLGIGLRLSLPDRVQRLLGFGLYRLGQDSSTRSSSCASSTVAGVSHRTLPPVQPRNPWRRLRSQGPAHSSRAISISATPRARSAWIPAPRLQSTETASLRVHSHRLPPAHTASYVPPEAHCTHRPPTP